MEINILEWCGLAKSKNKILIDFDAQLFIDLLQTRKPHPGAPTHQYSVFQYWLTFWPEINQKKFPNAFFHPCKTGQNLPQKGSNLLLPVLFISPLVFHTTYTMVKHCTILTTIEGSRHQVMCGCTFDRRFPSRMS